MIVNSCFALVLLMAAATPVAAAPFHHPLGEWREYNRDWLASCPDKIDEDATHFYGFSCFASTASAELNATKLPAYKLTVLRNRLTGAIDIAITVAADGVTTDTARPLVLAFGGEAPISLDFAGDLETRYDTANQFFVVDPVQRDALLDKMIARNSLVISVPLTGGATSSKQVWLSLRGLAASLDFMSSYARKVTEY